MCFVLKDSILTYIAGFIFRLHNSEIELFFGEWTSRGTGTTVLTYPCPTASRSRRAGVLVRGCAGARVWEVCGCPGVRLSWCPGVRVSGCPGVRVSGKSGKSGNSGKSAKAEKTVKTGKQKNKIQQQKKHNKTTTSDNNQQQPTRNPC